MNSKVTMGLRILLGLFLIMFGLNKFLGFIEFPPIPGDGGTLMGIYMTSGFMKIIGILELLAGAALLFGKFVPLALIFTAAIMLNAAIFHLLHAPEGVAGAAVGLILSLVLIFTGYRDRFTSVLSA